MLFVEGACVAVAVGVAVVVAVAVVAAVAAIKCAPVAVMVTNQHLTPHPCTHVTPHLLLEKMGERQ